ncbi:hypothetical protein PIB30_012194 [Stylosanthes scabra]|uniref:F-box domain-containing protein n=1 Tax=Stylosanthes scabra TaxID=79078 RepID=A0ABU6U5Y0_9FABA|nr:hypothetical protein [Stylosanthes scabra]
MDRISDLPKGILHDILGKLPDKDAAKTCVLSKSWRQTWFSFPILSLCSDDLPSSPKDIFIDYVTKRLMRLHDQSLTIKEFKLTLGYTIDRRQLAHHIDQWIQMAIESGVEVLELRLTGGIMDYWYKYNLPLCVTKAKSLTKLVLSGGIRLDPAFLNHSLKFFSMRTLSFSHIHFGDERVLEHFISHCPLIEHLTLEFCEMDNPQSRGDPPGSRTYPVKSLSLRGLQKLKGADVKGILEVYIDAPNLENLCYRAPSDRNASFKLNLDSCTKLKCLSLWGLRITDKWLLELLYKIPFLESLMLHSCSISEWLYISGLKLKFFRLLCCSNLKLLVIDAPNLLSCDYRGDDKPAISFLRNSNQPGLNAHFGYGHRDLYGLRKFVENIKPQKVLASLSLFIHETCSIRESMGALPVSSPPPSIKLVQLRFPMNKEAEYFPLMMNWLLSSCFPKTISFSLQYLNMKAFIVFFYEMLMDKKKCWCYHRSWHLKCCWWHGLKVVKVTHLERTYESVEDFEAILDALPETRVEEYVSFGLEL